MQDTSVSSTEKMQKHLHREHFKRYYSSIKRLKYLATDTLFQVSPKEYLADELCSHCRKQKIWPMCSLNIALRNYLAGEVMASS